MRGVSVPTRTESVQKGAPGGGFSPPPTAILRLTPAPACAPLPCGQAELSDGSRSGVRTSSPCPLASARSRGAAGARAEGEGDPFRARTTTFPPTPKRHKAALSRAHRDEVFQRLRRAQGSGHPQGGARARGGAGGGRARARGLEARGHVLSLCVCCSYGKKNCAGDRAKKLQGSRSVCARTRSGLCLSLGCRREIFCRGKRKRKGLAGSGGGRRERAVASGFVALALLLRILCCTCV